MNSTGNIKNPLIDLLSVFEYIQLKSKIKTLEVHQNMPWIVFSDLENNIMIFDVIDNKPIRAFNMSQFFTDNFTIKDLKFFNINDKQYVNNYDLNEIKKIKGIPFHLRSNLLIITLEKHICFYSCITQNFIKTITHVELEQKLPVKCEVFNYMYVLIQTADGSLIIWNILDWGLVRVINKTNIGKPVSNFCIVSTSSEEKFISVANTNGNLFLVDISKKDVVFKKLDEKTEHDANVLLMEFNPHTSILASISKNAILLNNIKNMKVSKRIPNFQFFKSEKPYGIIPNLNQNFTKHAYFIYGKTSTISSIELNLKLIKDRKLESKEMKNFISFNFDLELQNLPKVSDKTFKIYIAKFLNHTQDYLILGTNKGVLILRFNILCKPEITAIQGLNELNENKLFFYTIKNNSSLIEKCYSFNIEMPQNNGSSVLNVKKKEVLPAVFDNKSLSSSQFHRFKISFSYENTYMASLDATNSIYTIYKLNVNEELHYNLNGIKYGKSSGDLEWCPYENIFAVTSGLINQVSTKSSSSDKKGLSTLSNSFKMSFTLTLFQITNDSVSVLYVIDDLPCHRIFGGHYIGLLTNCVPTNNFSQEDLTYPGVFSNFTYSTGNSLVLNFYHWTEKIKLEISLSEEPKFVFSSADLNYMIVVFIDKYILYSISNEDDKHSLLPVNIFYYKIVHAIIYENLILIFLTDKGVYFHILNEENAYPSKLLKASDEMNMFHLKISKKIKENIQLFTKKLLPNKILGVFGNSLVLSSSFNKISFKPIDNLLFKIVLYITTRRYSEISAILAIVEKKYIKSVMAIFKHYFEGNEEITKKLLLASNGEMVEHFGLYKHESMFLNDYLQSPLMALEDKSKVDKCLKSWLVKYINSNDINGINNLYQNANQSALTFEILCSKYIDQNTFLKSMLVHNRNFESYVFNENQRMNEEMGDKILSRAYERINQSKVK